MKRIITLLVLTCLSLPLCAQDAGEVRVGVEVGPSLTWARTQVKDRNSNLDLESGKTRVNFTGGLMMDFFFTDNVAFSTGGYFVTRGADFIVRSKTGPTNFRVTNSLQYIQVPFGLKMYTNELGSSDMRAFLHVAGAADFRIQDRYEIEGTAVGTFDDPMTIFIDCSMILGLGVEIPVLDNNILCISSHYNRGFINILKGSSFYESNFDNIQVNNDTAEVRLHQVDFRLGFKF